MSPNFLFPAPRPGDAREEVEKQAAAGHIDSPANLRTSRVWLLSGGKDQVVSGTVVDAAHAFYLQWLPEAAIVRERLPEAGHAMIAPQAAGAGACAVNAPPYINRCGDFDAPARLLTHLLGTLLPKAQTADGELLTFRQDEFVAPEAGMAKVAYLYIPSGCRAGGCRIHVAFHGCRQNTATMGETYARESGYNLWAESNRLIVLYPQTSNSKDANGCWDWWGYTDPGYHLRSAPQIKAVRSMIERLMEKPEEAPALP